MSGRKNLRGRGSAYHQTASRLRDKLESRNPSEQQEKHPPGLRGREIGLWYKNHQRSKQKQENQENHLITGPNVTLSDEKVANIRRVIKSFTQNSEESKNSRFQNDFQRHISSNFTELLKASSEKPALLSSEEDDDNLRDEFMEKALIEEYVEMLEFRQKLPAYQKREEIINAINTHQVILIEGNTGCGKTTQVAQYVLDDALMNRKGSSTRILCTQPRRIAATSIAERVAAERAEELGNSVGYQIRLEKVEPRSSGYIKFCTTGVLIKFIEIDFALNNYSHIIIDEIHERNVQTDICLALLKQITLYRKDLKIILMSATLNAESFSNYFHNCPKIHIDGFSYSVDEFFLEDVIEKTGFNDFRQARVNTRISEKYKNFEAIVAGYANSLRGNYSLSTVNCILNPESEEVNTDLIESLILHISTDKPVGAILVILPGYSVISKLFDRLKESPKFPSSRFVIYPLHSLLTGSDQRSIFIRPPHGVRKIILATPLAETSITIDDVVYVINSGKMKKPSFDFERNAKVLEDQWITKANETQRKGRAGRVQAGTCYHLYTRARSKFFDEFETPEIQSIRLEEVLLTIKMLCIKDIQSFMATLIDIPSDEVIESSLNLLQRLGALTEKEELTPLGLHLARLSVHPQIGKTLLFSSIFSCIDPISSVAAALSFKSPFYSVMGKEEHSYKRKRLFSKDSDQLAAANAISTWKEMRHGQRQFCSENFLSHSTLLMLDRMKTQFLESLFQSKFLDDAKSNSDYNNRHSGNIDVLRAIICGGLYPNISYRSMKISRHKKMEKIKVGCKTVKLLQSSVNADENSVYDPGFMAYHELQKFTGGFFLMETTANIGPYAIIMFGDRVTTETIDQSLYIAVGDVAKFRSNHHTAELLNDLRDCFNQLLERKIAEPSPTDWDSEDGKLLKAIIGLISISSSSFEDYDEFSDEEDE